MPPKGRNPLTYLIIGLIITGIVLAGLVITATKAEEPFYVEVPNIDLPPETVITTTNPDGSQQLTEVVPKFEFSMSGIVRLLDANGKILEDWQIRPQSTVYEQAYGVTWEIEVTTRIESNILEWWTLSVHHTVYLVNADKNNAAQVRHEEYGPDITQAFKVSKDVWEMTKTYKGPLSKFSTLGLSTSNYSPTLSQILIHADIINTQEIWGSYVSTPDQPAGRARIIGGVYTYLFMDNSNIVVNSVLVLDDEYYYYPGQWGDMSIIGN
jgi:hypothetical protein